MATVHVNLCEEVHCHVGDDLVWHSPKAMPCHVAIVEPVSPIAPNPFTVPAHPNTVTTHVIGPPGTYHYHSACCPLDADPRLIVI
jgi:hypothetical protein